MNFRKSPAGCPAGRPYYTRKKLLCIGVKCGYRLVGVLTDGEEDVVAVGHQLIVLYQLQLLRQVLGPLGLQIILSFTLAIKNSVACTLTMGILQR